MPLELVLFIVGTLISILLAAITFIGNSIVKQLKSIAISVQRIEIDLGILNSDHQNLKERVENIEDDLKVIQKRKK